MRPYPQEPAGAPVDVMMSLPVLAPALDLRGASMVHSPPPVLKSLELTPLDHGNEVDFVTSPAGVPAAQQAPFLCRTLFQRHQAAQI
jgi:hypothetical protein